MNRLFVALDIPSNVQDELIDIRNKIYGIEERIKWEVKEKLHLTLKFLGDVEESRNSEIIKILEDTSLQSRKFGVEFTKFGTFSRDNKLRILWVGLNGFGLLERLQKEIETNLEVVGFKKENRRFKPHLTLLRLKGYEDLNKIRKFSEFRLPEIKFTVDKISLIKSKLTPQGSIYTRLKSFKMN